MPRPIAVIRTTAYMQAPRLARAAPALVTLQLGFWSAGMRLLAVFVFGCLIAIGSPTVTAATLAKQARQVTGLAEIQSLFDHPDRKVDFAAAKIAIDRTIDPSIDSAATLEQIDAWAAVIAARVPVGSSYRGKLDALLSTLYEPGPWNQNRPFSYDLNDPFGKNRRNKLLSTYLLTRKGNCVSMPILVLILGQRLGLAVTLATAPEHVLVKFVDDEGQYLNVEATAGGFKYDSSYERETGITPTAIQNEIYLRPLTSLESVGVMASTLMEHYGAEKRGDKLLAVAEMVLAVNPKDVVAIIHKANAYYLQLQQRFVSRYPTPAAIPKDQLADYVRLSHENLAWFARAEKLGWAPPMSTKDANYLQSIERERARRGE